MEVYKPGTPVYCDPDREVTGKIVRVLVDSPRHVRYRVSYWTNGTRKEKTFSEWEIGWKPDSERVEVGFNKNDAD